MKYLIAILICMLCAATAQTEEHGHDGHEHGDEENSKVLGDITLGKATLEASYHTKLQAGKEFGMELELEKGPAPATLRAWIGIKNGRGSVKALLKLDKSGKKYHFHLEAPKEIVAAAKLWFESVDAAGNKIKASLDLPKDKASDHDHKDGDDHDHKDGDDHDHKEKAKDEKKSHDDDHDH